ncbi:MAG: DUF4277 domain-containing protein [Candidatus Electrothrix sp. ATG2]|nr:DUF4277 domain-containing protein [Candidatus Electrothrix sp. ATG2]
MGGTFLYLTPHFFQDKPVDRLIGEGIKAQHLNDTTLGRALDDIYDYNHEVLYPQLALRAVDILGLLTLSLSQEVIHAVAPDLMEDPEKAAFRSLGTNYGDVSQRWLVDYSPEAYQRVKWTP